MKTLVIGVYIAKFFSFRTVKLNCDCVITQQLKYAVYGSILRYHGVIILHVYEI
jgi:hypothetical protein